MKEREEDLQACAVSKMLRRKVINLDKRLRTPASHYHSLCVCVRVCGVRQENQDLRKKEDIKELKCVCNLRFPICKLHIR